MWRTMFSALLVLLSVSVCEAGRALRLNRQSVAIPPVTLVGDFTVSAWVKLDRGFTSADAVVGNTKQMIHFHGGILRMFSGFDMIRDVVRSKHKMQVGVWTHCAVVRTGAESSLYINGVLDATAAGARPEFKGAGWSDDFVVNRIGRGLPNTEGIKGVLDDLHIWSEARTSLEIVQEMNGVLAGNTGALQRQYSFEGTVNAIVDDTGKSAQVALPARRAFFVGGYERPPLATMTGAPWIVESTQDWFDSLAASNNVDLGTHEGSAKTTANQAHFESELRPCASKCSAKSITLEQAPLWHNWKPTTVLPQNLQDAPIALTFGEKNHWVFGRYTSNNHNFTPQPATLDGFDMPLQTTRFQNQFNAPGGLQPGLGGYHAWQSRDMKNWVHHGPVSTKVSRWSTTAEQVDGKLYLYYDFPNDQDPHLYIDDDLFDGKPGTDMGLAFKDPSDGSDCAIIRELDGSFHLIYEDWSPINAKANSWDSPLAGHAVSVDGTGDFTILPPAVDERTTPTGTFAEYPHPHWFEEDPQNFPKKPGTNFAYAKYEIHEPKQNAYGDWSVICVGGQYYLFGDYDQADGHLKIGWFTSSSLDEQFTFVGELGSGHPDPDIMFADGSFYLLTQVGDYVSPGPWVGSVEVRVGVNTAASGPENIVWTDWQEVEEVYDYIPGFSKQIAKRPAELDVSDLPAGYGFRYMVRTNASGHAAQPVFSKITLDYNLS